MADSSSLPQPPQVTEAMVEAVIEAVYGPVEGRWAGPESPGISALIRQNMRETIEVVLRVAALGAPETPPPQWDFEEPTEAETPMMALGELLAHTYAEDGSRKPVNPDDVEYWVKAARLASSSPPPPATPSEEAIEAAKQAAPLYTDDQVSNAARVTAESVIRSPNTFAYQIRLSIREWLDENGDGGLLAILRAAYAVDFGAQSRPEAKHPAPPAEEAR